MLQFVLDEDRYLLVADKTSVGLAPAAFGTKLEAGRSLACEPLDDDVGTQAFDKVTDEGHIVGEFVMGTIGKDGSGVVDVLLTQRRTSEQLQLVQLDRIQRQTVDDVGLGNNLVTMLAGKAQHEMAATKKTMTSGGLDGSSSDGKSVPPVDALQSGIVTTLDAIFHSYEMAGGKGGEIVEDVLVDAIGAGAHHEACNAGMEQSLGIALTQHIERSIGVAISLEIGKINRCFAVATIMKQDSLVDLLRDALRRDAIGRVERIVVAKGTAASAQSPVTIRTGKTRIDGKFLRTATETLSKKTGKIVIPHGNEKRIRMQK